MNTAALALAPLRATTAGTRWSVLGMLGVMLAIAVTLQWMQGAASAVWIAPVMSGYGECFAGMLVIAPSLRLAIDARQLCLPHSQTAIVLGMLGYSLAWIALPSIVLALTGVNLAAIVAIHTLGLLFGLALGLLPRVCLIASGLPPAFLGALHSSPNSPEASVLLTLLALAAVLAGICTLCWRRQLRLDDPYRRGFNRPLAIFQATYRPGLAHTTDRLSYSGSLGQLRALPQWLLEVVDLRRTGPAYPVDSLRVVLGGWLAPKTWQSMARRWLLVVAPVATIAVIFFLWLPDATLGALRLFFFSPVIWIIGFGSTFAGLNTVLVVQRCTQMHADASLLALLPGLKNGGRSPKKLLLRASLLPPLRWQVVLLALLIAISLTGKVTGTTLALAMLSQLNALMFAPAFALAYFSGCRVAPWMPGLVGGISFASIGCSTAAVALMQVSSAHAWILATAIGVAQLATLAYFAWLGTRGWRSFVYAIMPMGTTSGSC